MSPDLNEFKETKEERHIINRNNRDNGFLSGIKNKLKSIKPEERGYNEKKTVNGKETRKLSPSELEKRFMTSKSNLENHLIKFCETDNLKKKLVDVLQHWIQTDFPEETKEEIKEAINEVDWDTSNEVEADE